MMQVEMPVSSLVTDEELEMIREMAVRYLAVNFTPEDATYERVARFQERVAAYDLEVANGGAMNLYKSQSIILGKPDRDEVIDKYNEFTRVLGQLGIRGGYIAWQPNGIFRTKVAVGEHTHGAPSMFCDMAEISARPISNDRVYGEQEIWDNFAYFLKRALPVCEEADVKIALHPNDPPVESLGGVRSLIYRSEDYRRAFELSGNSPYLGMKMCTGCWLETGDAFGDLLADIDEFVRAGKVLTVHFRNVSAQVPVFEETLAEDGYADMFAIARQLVRSGYEGMMNVDHVFRAPDGGEHTFAGGTLAGGSIWSAAYATGYMKGLIDGAYKAEAAAGSGVPVDVAASDIGEGANA